MYVLRNQGFERWVIKVAMDSKLWLQELEKHILSSLSFFLMCFNISGFGQCVMCVVTPHHPQERTKVAKIMNGWVGG